MARTVLAIILSAIGSTVLASGEGAIDTTKSPHVKLRSIPMQDTQLTGGFWKERFDLCADQMIPTMKKAMSGPGSAKLGRLEWAAGIRSDNENNAIRIQGVICIGLPRASKTRSGVFRAKIQVGPELYAHRWLNCKNLRSKHVDVESPSPQPNGDYRARNVLGVDSCAPGQA